LIDFALLAVGTLFHTMVYKIILNNGNGKQLQKVQFFLDVAVKAAKLVYQSNC